ncbi:DPP IV N-terminal domain-containing protein [Parapedobacter sp. ISTM3]|uniref:DPP IV N-terminal domain-containing protein n=1 Tax=Parapedobacter sp. ISTM3 TaxID=2800130 RepID=UPI001F443B7F|nr:DPP IV N-terminal domain-containing protein [Parapedobacter sp. ISTM3]
MTYLNRFVKLILLNSCLVLMFSAIGLNARAQYFGQNKMRYKSLKFQVYETPHFNLHYYLQNDTLIRWLAKESEVWYELHQQVFRDTFLRKNPIILYSNHPEFQQTTTIQGEIGVGTGGVTEAFKTRVVMPVMQINHQTRHVLGHELVHAFQYRVLMEGGDSTRLENIGNIPLWMVEGMAEYFSIGKKDAFTAMWMRDAYINNDIPSLRAMTENMNRYFPYRFGQAFWAYIGSTYGDTVIMPLFKATAMYGYEMGIRRVFGYDAQTLSNLWRNSMENAYRNLPVDTGKAPVGRSIINSKNSGRLNVSPAISPDGKYVAFMSERDLFSIDLFLADAQTGDVIRKLSSRLTNTDIDEFSYLESAGAFSPDSKKFAFSVFSRGRSKLMVVDVANGKTLALEAMGDITEFANIAWAPDGETVAFSGLKNGHSDIYLYNLNTKKLTQLTDDWYSDFQPSFSHDGRYIVFSTDRVALQSDTRSVDIPMNIAMVDVETGEITNVDVFQGANNLNPQFSADDSQIYFLSNSDGFRNMYRYTLAERKVERMTEYFTGISGITEYSPALSLSVNGDVVYSYYRRNEYSVYNAKVDEFEPKEVDPYVVNFDAAMLPPPENLGVDVVNANLSNFNLFQRISDKQISSVAYKPNFKLDYLANSGMGLAVGSRYGAGIASGIQGMFSDILGHNQIFAALSINGEIYDFGGQVAYINQRSRINWGGAVSHIPFMSGYSLYSQRDVGNGPEPILDTYIIRTFQQQAEAFGAYPFSRHHRFEMGGAFARYSYRVDRWWQSYLYGYGGRDRVPNDEASGIFGGNFNAFTIQQINTSFVGDNAVFGIAAPLQGFRYRVGMEQYFGDFNFRAYTFDLRKYNRYQPVTIAARAYTYMRSGRNEDALFPLFLGYPHLIRGYESASFRNNMDQRFNFNSLMGTRIAVFNFEVRLPFTGPERLAVLRSNMLFSDLNFFFDAGLAWDSSSKVAFRSTPRYLETVEASNGQMVDVYERIPALSAGVSLRVNLFGAMVLEPYYAFPFQRTDVNFGTFGLNFAPGW